MINILKLNNSIFEVIKFELDYDNIKTSDILVEVISEKDIETAKNALVFIWNNTDVSEYTFDAIAIVDNIQYNITGAFLSGHDSNIGIKSAYIGFTDISWERLENNYSGLTEKDRQTIKSLEGINKFQL